jgi:hypothetical protein
LTTDQRRWLGREVGRPVFERCQRGEVTLESVADELKDPLRPAQILQTVLAEIAQDEFLGQVVTDQLSRGLRDKHLATMPCGGNPGAPVNVHSDVAFIRLQRLTCVDSHPNPNRPRAQGALRFGRGGDRVSRSGVRDEERIALGIDLDPAVGT